MQLAERKTKSSGSFKGSKPSCFAGRRNGRSVVSLLGSMKTQCTTRETSKLPGCLGTMLSKFTTPKGDGKKLERAGSERRKKSKIDFQYSKLSVEDRLYLKSQLAIWFPIIVHHPTLSELETALAEMGTKILRNMAAFHIMDLNSILTESKGKRRLYRKRHHVLTPRDLKILLSDSPLDKRGVDKCMEVDDSKEGKPRQKPFTLTKLRQFNKTETSNSFINAEKNWRHNLMSEQAIKISESQKKAEKPGIDSNQLRLLQMYDRQNYDIPGWFYRFLEFGNKIDLELMNTDELSEVTPEEVNILAWPPRRISLNLVPTGSSSFVKGHLFVSVIEQERVLHAGDDCKNANVSTNNKMSKLLESSGSRKLLLLKNVSGHDLSSKQHGSKPSEKARREFPEDSCGQEDFFPNERILSFRHNWSHVPPNFEYKSDKNRWKSTNRERVRSRDKCMIRTSEFSNDGESNNSVPLEHSGYKSVLQDSKARTTDSILTPTQIGEGSTVNRDARGTRRLLAKIRKLLSVGETKRNDKTLRTSSGKVGENDDGANMISSLQAFVNRPSQNVAEICTFNKHSFPISLSALSPESTQNTTKLNAKNKPKNVENNIYKNKQLVGISLEINKNFNNLIAGERNIETTPVNNTMTLSPGCRLQEKSLSERRSKRRKGTVRFKNSKLVTEPLDKSNSSLNESSGYFISHYLVDDLSSARLPDGHCMLNKSQNSNTEYKEGNRRGITKRSFQMTPTRNSKTRRNYSMTKNSFVRNGKGASEMSKVKDYIYNWQNAWARQNENDHLRITKVKNCSARSSSDSPLSSTLSNDAIRGSVMSFVREQWRSCNVNSTSSSSKDSSDFQNSSDGQSSCATSESSSTKARVSIKPEKYPNAAWHRHINTDVGGRRALRPVDKSSLWSTERQKEDISCKQSDLVKTHNPDSNTVHGDVITRMYKDFEKDVKIRLKSSGLLNESNRDRATAGPCANAQSEFNGNNENLLTHVASTSTSSVHKFTTATKTNQPLVDGAHCSPTCRNQSTNPSWMTLRDLSSLLAYCARVLSTNEPLAEGTIEILKAVDKTLSWYFIEDDCGHLPRDEVTGAIQGPRNRQREKEMPKKTLGLKHQECREVSSSRCKTKSINVRSAKWPDCVNLSARRKDECPNYITGSSYHLDETQNKLDSDQDDIQATRAQVASNTENPMRQELDEPDSWQLHQRNSEGADRPQQASRHELPPPPHTYLNDSVSAVLSPYDDWPRQPYTRKAPEQYASMPDPSEAEQSKKDATQKRQYFEQKIGHQTGNEPTHIRRRCAQNMAYETDATAFTPFANCPEAGGAFRQKRFLDSNCQRFSLNLTNSYKPSASHPSMCCNKTTSCSENPCSWNNSSPRVSRGYYPSHCLDCLDRISGCGGMRKEIYSKTHFTVPHGCHRHGLSDFPSRLQSPIVPHIPSVPRRMFDFPGHKCCFPAASALRPCRQTIGDMTSEFEKRFGFPEETVPMRKVLSSENLSMYNDELTELSCGLDNSPALMRYVNLVPNIKKTRTFVQKPSLDHRTSCCKENVESETIEYIKELLRACIARERHEDNAFKHRSNSEDRIKTCKLSDDDRQLFESLKCKLDSKLLQSFLKPDEFHGTVPTNNQTTQSDARAETPYDCPCQQRDPSASQGKTRGPCCMCCGQESKPACKTEATRMHSKGLQADMSWAPGKSRETSSQTCKDFDDYRYRCACCKPLDIGTCSVKPAHVCECVGIFAEESPRENERLVSTGCRVTPKAYQSCAESDKRPRCTVIEDISSCTHQGRASANRTEKRNKALQTTLVCRLSPPCIRCVPRPREASCSACMSHSDIYPKLSPERVSMVASSRACRERDHCWVHKKLKSELEKSRPTCGSRPHDRSSFYVKKWECPLEGSPLASYLTDCIDKPRITPNNPDPATFVPITSKRPLNVFNGRTDKCQKNETHPLKPAWPDCEESKQKDCYKEQLTNEPCAKDSPDVDRPIVHIRYKSKKASGKSEITVDSIPCNEDQITSPVRNLALELKKHVQKIIQNSKELKQQALIADKCPKAGGNIRQENDAKTPSSNNPPEMVRFHSSRKDDGSWSYEMKIKSPVLRKPEEMSESYASKNVNCGNNNFGDMDPKQKSVYGVKINVTLPETYVNDDTDRLIREVLPEILKIVLCVILKVNSNGVDGQSGDTVQSSRKQHKGLHENVNSNACSDNSVRDNRECYNAHPPQENHRFPTPTLHEHFQKTPRRKLPGRGDKLPLQASIECYKHANISTFDKSERYVRSIQPRNKGRNTHKVKMECSTHRCTTTPIRRKNKRSQSESICGRQFHKTSHTQTEISLENHLGHPAKYDDVKEFLLKDNEKTIADSQMCKRAFSNKGHTVIIEDFSSLEKSSSKSRQVDTKSLCQCNCTRKSKSSCGSRNLKFDKPVRASEKGIQSSGWNNATEYRAFARLLARGRKSRDTNTCTSHYVPHQTGAVCSHPCVVMECYDSTPEFTTITPTESRDDHTIHQASTNRQGVDGDQTHLAKAEHLKSSRPLPLSKKMADGKTSGQNATHCCPAQLEEAPSASRRGPPPSKKFARSSGKIKRSISDDSADSCHGIDDLPVDSGVSGTLIKNIETGTKRNAEAGNVDANRGKHSIRESDLSAKTSKWNISKSEARDICPPKRAIKTSGARLLVDKTKTGEHTQEYSSTPVKKALIELWNCPNEKEDNKDDHPSSTLVEAPELSRPTYRRSVDCKLPVIMSNQRIVSAVLGGEVGKNTFRGLVERKDSATLTENRMTCDKSTGVRDTKIRKPIFAIPNSSSVDVRNDTAVELNETSKLPTEAMELSSEVKLHLRPDSVAKTTQDDQLWQNVFVGSAELTEATSHRVVLEGAFYKSRQPGDGPVGQTEMCSSFLPQGSTLLLPFRLVLLTSSDGSNTVRGTYLRRMGTTDRFLKWNINLSMPEGTPLEDMV